MTEEDFFLVPLDSEKMQKGNLMVPTSGLKPWKNIRKAAKENTEQVKAVQDSRHIPQRFMERELPSFLRRIRFHPGLA